MPYREASIEDKEQLKSLGIAAYGGASGVLTPDNQARLSAFLHSDDTWLDLLDCSKSFVYVDGENIVGMAFLVPSGNPWDIFKAEWSYIRMVGVAPPYQNQGIAKALTKMCIDHAKAP